MESAPGTRMAPGGRKGAAQGVSTSAAVAHCLPAPATC